MGVTANYALRYPELADPPLVQQNLKNLASDVDLKVPSVPIGASSEWDYGSAQMPSWALLQYGQAVSRATYPALHSLASAASYPHGNGDGSLTFNIADKRGRVSVGKDDMGGTAANRITAAISGAAGTALGVAVGSEGVTLATAQIPSHDHAAATGLQSADHTHYGNTGYVSVDHSHAIGDPTHAHNVTYGKGWYNAGYPGSTDQWYSFLDSATWGAGGGWYTGGISVNHVHGINTGYISADHNHQVYAQGGGGVHLNMQPTIIVNKVVRAL